MIAFITSSPFREDVDRPTFSNQNRFMDRIRACLPEYPRCLYICSSPDRHDLNCRFGADVFMAFANMGIHFSSYDVLDNTNAYLAAYVIILFVSFVLVSIDSHSVATNFTAVLSCFNNMGPGLEAVGPTCNYSSYSAFSKIILCLDMLAGRLEIFPILVLLSRSTWKR